MTHKIKAVYSLIVFCVFCCAANAFSQASAVAELKEDELLMGRTLPLTVTVSAPDNSAKVEFPILKGLKENSYFSMVDGKVEITPDFTVDTLNEGPGKSLRYNLTIQAFDSGRYEIPNFQLLVNGDTVKSNPLSLNVLPVKVKADDELDPIADVQEPFKVKYADDTTAKQVKRHLNNFWWLYLVALAVLAATVYLWYRYRTTGALFAPAKQIPPFEAALRRLKALKGKNLWQTGHVKEYYSRLTDILRLYLKDGFEINAMEMTSRQILKAMKKNPDVKEYVEKIRPVLSTSDFVKFAKDVPEAATNEEMFDRVKEFVELTKPAPEETEEKKGGKA